MNTLEQKIDNGNIHLNELMLYLLRYPIRLTKHFTDKIEKYISGNIKIVSNELLILFLKNVRDPIFVSGYIIGKMSNNLIQLKSYKNYNKDGYDIKEYKIFNEDGGIRKDITFVIQHKNDTNVFISIYVDNLNYQSRIPKPKT